MKECQVLEMTEMSHDGLAGPTEAVTRDITAHKHGCFLYVTAFTGKELLSEHFVESYFSLRSSLQQ